MAVTCHLGREGRERRVGVGGGLVMAVKGQRGGGGGDGARGGRIKMIRDAGLRWQPRGAGREMKKRGGGVK